MSSYAEDKQSQGLRLDVRQLRVSVGRKALLADVSFTAFAGELTGIIGLSGSGKSTLLNAVCGMQPTESGKMFLGGKALEPGPATGSRIGYCTQDSTIHPSLRLRQALWYAGLLRAGRGASRRELGERLDAVLESVDLTDRRRSRISTLSGGERRRANIGAELMADPPLLLLDEPTAGLDPALETQMMQLFRRMADEGRTLLVTTHVMGNLKLFDVIMILSDGHLCFYGPTEDVLKFFDCDHYERVFDLIREVPGAQWAARFRETTWWPRYCLQRYHDPVESPRAGRPEAAPAEPWLPPTPQAIEDDLDIVLEPVTSEPLFEPSVTAEWASDESADTIEITFEGEPPEPAAPTPPPAPTEQLGAAATQETAAEPAAPPSGPQTPAAKTSAPTDVEASTAVCLVCGREISATAEFCRHCGATQVKCPNCGGRVDGRDRFCWVCGAEIPRGGD